MEISSDGPPSGGFWEEISSQIQQMEMEIDQIKKDTHGDPLNR